MRFVTSRSPKGGKSDFIARAGVLKNTNCASVRPPLLLGGRPLHAERIVARSNGRRRLARRVAQNRCTIDGSTLGLVTPGSGVPPFGMRQAMLGLDAHSHSPVRSARPWKASNAAIHRAPTIPHRCHGRLPHMPPPHSSHLDASTARRPRNSGSQSRRSGRSSPASPRSATSQRWSGSSSALLGRTRALSRPRRPKRCMHLTMRLKMKTRTARRATDVDEEEPQHIDHDHEHGDDNGGGGDVGRR